MAKTKSEGAGAETPSDGNDIVLGKSKNGPQKRIGRRSDWTAAKEKAFADVLADTCNVTLAARAIKRSIANVYKHRSRSAEFRSAWDAALAVGYSRLELMLLERALHGVEKRVTARDGTTTVMREYPDRVALALLRMHRETVAITDEPPVDNEEWIEARDRIIERLQRLRERDERRRPGNGRPLALPLAGPSAEEGGGQE